MKQCYPEHAALRQLVAKLEEIHEHPRFKAVWETAHFRLGPYDGPTYTEELAAAKTALSGSDAQSEPFAWVIGRDNNANDKGFIDAMAWSEGEFTTPVYLAPQPVHPAQATPDPALRNAAIDALAGWKYIRKYHGDLYGVGWDRVEIALETALAPANHDS